ncbi:hypothetical protein BC567DRAFT_217714 [Phyllosticta citribraziliensis]
MPSFSSSFMGSFLIGGVLSALGPACSRGASSWRPMTARPKGHDEAAPKSRPAAMANSGVLGYSVPSGDMASKWTCKRDRS